MIETITTIATTARETIIQTVGATPEDTLKIQRAERLIDAIEKLCTLL